MSETAAARTRRRLGHRAALEAAVLAALVVAAAWNQVDHFARIPAPRAFNDTASYLRGSEFPLASAEIWFGVKPPLTPLWFKLLGRDPVAITRAQLAASLVAWSTLAVAVARAMRTWWLRPAACALVLAFSMTDAIAQWHKTLLSDSLSMSLLALLAAAWIVQLERGDRTSRAAAVVLGVLYGLVRDTNAYTLALVAAVLAATAALGRARPSTQSNGPAFPPPAPRARVAIAAVYAATFAMSWASINAGERWMPAFYNNVSQRILPYPERTQWFAAAGMPVDDALAERRGKWAWDDDSAYFSDARLERFRQWVRERGKGAYARFLAERPLYVVTAPLGDLENLAFPKLAWMQPDGYSPPLRGVPGIESVSSARLLPAYLLALAAVLAAGIVRRDVRGSALYRAGAAMIVLAVPGVLLSWHASPMEVQRHVLHSVVLARLGLVLAGVAVLDEIARSVGRRPARTL